jgi:hypothetical protein
MPLMSGDHFCVRARCLSRRMLQTHLKHTSEQTTSLLTNKRLCILVRLVFNDSWIIAEGVITYQSIGLMHYISSV